MTGEGHGHNVRVLTGHSGVDILLMDNGPTKIVRKIARNAVQNPRLNSQHLKLLHAAEAGIACPRVLGTGESDGKFFFDMEYISGETLAHAAITGRRLNWERIVDRVVAQIQAFANTERGVFDEGVFEEKIASIISACHKKNPRYRIGE